MIDGSPAAAAGVGAGDVIIKLGATTIGSAGDLTTALAKHNPKDKVGVTWVDTAGTTQTATVQLAASPVA